jgi:SH3-like domain-containing protein
MIKILFFNIILIFIFFFNNYAHALCINVPEANLRKGPGTKYEKTWEVFKYMPFQKISKKNNWYKVKDLDGDIHWIYWRLVTDKIKCAVVKGEDVNIRKGPGTGYEKTYLSPTMKYDTFRVIKIKGSWVNIVDDFDNTGWIFRKLLWIQ